MKINHNKKRNTLFLYEALVREYTKAKLENDPRKLQEIRNLFVEYFSEGKVEASLRGEELSIPHLQDTISYGCSLLAVGDKEDGLPLFIL